MPEALRADDEEREDGVTCSAHLLPGHLYLRSEIVHGPPGGAVSPLRGALAAAVRSRRAGKTPQRMPMLGLALLALLSFAARARHTAYQPILRPSLGDRLRTTL